jgi:hypothetical protein
VVEVVKVVVKVGGSSADTELALSDPKDGWGIRTVTVSVIGAKVVDTVRVVDDVTVTQTTFRSLTRVAKNERSNGDAITSEEVKMRESKAGKICILLNGTNQRSERRAICVELVGY